MKLLQVRLLTYVRMIGVSPTASSRQFHSWHTLRARVHTGLYMGASNNARLHWIIHPREREGEKKRDRKGEREIAKATVLSFASLPSSLSPFFASSFAYSILFFLARRGKEPCIRLPVLPRSFIFSLFPSARADLHSMKKRRMKKSRAPWPSVIRTCHVVVEKSVAESRILFEESCPATGFHAVISETGTNLLRVMRY